MNLDVRINITDIETPDSGRIVLNGRVLFDSDAKINLPPQLRRTDYLFQNYALFPNMTVAENILFAAVGTEAEQRQQQRVAFARILPSHLKWRLEVELADTFKSYGGFSFAQSRRSFPAR